MLLKEIAAVTMLATILSSCNPLSAQTQLFSAYFNSRATQVIYVFERTCAHTQCFSVDITCFKEFPQCTQKNLLSASGTVITLNPGNKDTERLFNGWGVDVFLHLCRLLNRPCCCAPWRARQQNRSLRHDNNQKYISSKCDRTVAKWGFGLVSAWQQQLMLLLTSGPDVTC